MLIPRKKLAIVIARFMPANCIPNKSDAAKVLPHLPMGFYVGAFSAGRRIHAAPAANRRDVRSASAAHSVDDPLIKSNATVEELTIL